MTFSQKETYKCVCGKEFQTANSFNGHKAHCPEHQIQKHGSLEFYKQVKKTQNINRNETVNKKWEVRKQQRLEKWISEQHTCEKCGKVMTEKFASGRFCSKSCANSRVFSQESKLKKSNTLKIRNKQPINRLKRNQSNIIRHETALKRYNIKPSTCTVCGVPLSYDKKNRKTCSETCLKKYYSIKIQNTRSTIGQFQVTSNYKWGYWKGYHCDSSWELAFLVYIHEKTNVELPSRNKDSFEYNHNGKLHHYYPDFIFNNNVYVEIKGRITDEVIYKINQFPKNKRLIVLYGDDLSICINYCKNKYGSKYWEKLYDKGLPNCMN